jgi:hypothetical protein
MSITVARQRGQSLIETNEYYAKGFNKVNSLVILTAHPIHFFDHTTEIGVNHTQVSKGHKCSPEIICHLTERDKQFRYFALHA